MQGLAEAAGVRWCRADTLSTKREEAATVLWACLRLSYWPFRVNGGAVRRCCVHGL